MAKITGFSCVDESGKAVAVDAHGNNVAIICPGCREQPLLIIAREHQRGGDKRKPATCEACGANYWAEVDDANERLVLNRVS